MSALERKFACNVCDKKFNHRSTLKNHIMMHNGERTHFCSECGHGFIKSWNLKRSPSPRPLQFIDYTTSMITDEDPLRSVLFY